MEQGFKSRSYLVSMAVFLVLICVTYWMLLRQYPAEELQSAIRMVDVRLLLLAAFCAFGFPLGESFCLFAILRSLRSSISYLRCLACSLIGVYFCAITPSSSGGQPAQLYYLKTKNVSIAHGTVALVLIAVVYKVVILLVGLPLVFLDAPIVFIGIPYFRILFAYGIILNTLLVIGSLMLMFSKKLIYKFTDGVLHLLQKLHLTKRSEKTRQKINHQLEEFHAAAEYLRTHIGVVLKTALYTFLQRLSMFSVAYCVYRAFGLHDLSWIDILAIQIALSLAVDALPLPGAVGASESVFLGLYRGIYGAKLLVPALILVRGTAFYMPAMFCGLFTAGCIVLNVYKKRRRGNET